MTVDEYNELIDGSRTFCYYPDLKVEAGFPDNPLNEYDLMLTDCFLEWEDTKGLMPRNLELKFDKRIKEKFPWFRQGNGYIWAIIIKGMPVTANLIDTQLPKTKVSKPKSKSIKPETNDPPQKG